MSLELFFYMLQFKYRLTIYFKIVCMETSWTFKVADGDFDGYTDLNSVGKG
jgi:hypothetical protein